MLIGHLKQKKYFKNLIENGSLGHAYLFSGPEMIGKKTFACEFAKTILGNGLDKNFDFKLISPKTEDGESKIYIEDIRDLKKLFLLKTHEGGFRVVVIDNAHCLTIEASNALLKLLEEPPARSVIILVSSAPGLILPTVVSRCENVGFLAVGQKEVDDYLVENKVKKEDKEFLAKLAGGRVGLISRLLEADGILEARKAVDDLRKLLGSRIYEKLEYAKKIHEKGDYQPRIDYWLNWVSAHVASSPKNEKIVKNLLVLNQLISQPQFNHRLALENFLLNLQ